MAKTLKTIILILLTLSVLYIGWITTTGELETLFKKEQIVSDNQNDSKSEQVETSIEETESPLIATVPSEYAIEAKVTLTGEGTGYHAKLVAATKDSAVSFGIQYDLHGEGEYNDRTAFLIENIKSNNAGGQEYTRTGYSTLGDSYDLMLTVENDGTCNAYVNGEKVGSVVNEELIGKQIYLRVEGSGRVNGDSVEATFEDIKLKGSGKYIPNKFWRTHNFDTNPGISSNVDQYKEDKTVVIKGTVEGLSPTEDWDSAYESVSGIIQFVE